MVSTLQYSEIFNNFAGRDDELRKIIRYAPYKMLYRSNLLTHSHRVAAITRQLNPIATKTFGADNYKPDKAEIMAYIHDDAEIIFGDVLAGYKAMMSTQQLAEIKRSENTAIEQISKIYPQNIAGYNYHDLLLEVEEHKTLESQVVQFADKYDALGEALHEIHAGNWHFITNINNEYGRIDTPAEYYYKYFKNFFNRFPDLKKLPKKSSPLFADISEPSYYYGFAKSGKLHTKDSVHANTGDNHYDQWRSIVLRCSNTETIGALYAPKESL